MSKILIIEDEPDTAKVVARRLTQGGFEVVVAVDAYEGVKLAHKERPDLIILDLMLPAGGGVSVLEKIRMSADIRTTPVVVLTGSKNEDYKQRIIDQGVEAYLEKPYEPDVLISTIQEILNK
ncbi:MAG TPA: response regulator transcription factor [Candidatus Margulisiibacteriota bacterium]|nr:response regulator transcription factor [Candidatus Margulisiibacteriota bacterium]